MLTGTKKGCGHGQCGSCTALIAGHRIDASLTPAATLDGLAITTIEGLGQPGNLHPLQAAPIEHDGDQGGRCTPGQIVSAQGLISGPRTYERMNGNLCRCGAYADVADAALEVLGGRRST